MPEYRIFQLDDAGQITGPAKTIICDDDQAVIHEARNGLNGAVLEIWSGPRRIAVLGKDDDKPRI
jgi:hypothetical protein